MDLHGKMATDQNDVPRIHVPMLSDPEGLDRTLDPEGLDGSSSHKSGHVLNTLYGTGMEWIPSATSILHSLV